jgi:prolyl-tRNA synthetase
MRWSETYIPTLREIPAEAELKSHQFLIRAGYIRRLTAGVFGYVPLMHRVIDKISTIIRDELTAAAAIEISLPILQPVELWQKSGRYEVAGKELIGLKDRHLHNLLIGSAHDEAITGLLAGELKSYRQFPLALFHIQTGFRDEMHPGHGLLRGREFMIAEGYSFDIDQDTHEMAFAKMIKSFSAIFERFGLPIINAKSAAEYAEEGNVHKFIVEVAEGGDTVVLSCNMCDYSADLEIAVVREPNPSIHDIEPKPLIEVETPNATTVEDVTAFLNVSAQNLAKTLLYMADGEPVAAMIRGDRQINEAKLTKYLKCQELEMAGPEIVEHLSRAPVGFAGPVGLEIPIIIDPELEDMTNFITGANKADAHFLNVNLNRDFKGRATVDIKKASPGDGCPICDGRLVQSAGLEIGRAASLGTGFAETLGGKFLDSNGKEIPYYMGSYSIGITRLAQIVTERFHDEKGIIWPKTIAPFQIVLMPLNITREGIREAADRLYLEMKEAGFDVLYDDRDERAGVKFNDSDLIGIPLRVAIGERSLARGEAELKLRGKKELESARIDDTIEKATKMLKTII